jgi:hypothetical protein
MTASTAPLPFAARGSAIPPLLIEPFCQTQRVRVISEGRHRKLKTPLVLTGLLAFLTAAAHADWKPSKNPDPEKILREAQDDAAAGRYADALAKHVWFHQNALTHAPGMYGVRLSFALSYWKELAAAYPPALTKLEAIRDAAGTTVRESRDSRHAFHDFVAINRELEEQQRTRDLFVWLDANKPEVARQDFDIAEPALIEAKEYRLCGKYLDPDRSLKRMVNLYRETTKIASEYQDEFAAELRDQSTKSFSNEVATLVALLVLNDRAADADRIASEAMKEWSDVGFREQLEKARKGEVPPPWP